MTILEQELTGHVTVALSMKQLDLLDRMFEGYVGLASYLTQHVKVRFPERAESINEEFGKMHTNIHSVVERHRAAQAVFRGTAVAVNRDRLAKLEAAWEQLNRPITGVTGT